MKVLLSTTNVVAGYVPDVPILNGVTIEVRQGEIVTIVGPNGAGKSTLVKTVFGLLVPRAGQVLLDGVEIGGRRPHEVALLGLGYVPQRDNVFSSLTVRENLELGSFERARTAERIDRMYELFPRLGERAGQRAGTMSGGERQMVAMARALMPEPRMLLVDEPSAGLSPAFVDILFEQIRAVNAQGVTILMVEQNARRALAMSDRGYVLDLGVERFEGRGSDLLDDPNVAALYLGGAARIDGPAAR
ncbi:ABC transporter ATP-binding protein [Conexibacter woesei]|uniref:ABC transporter related protein n=1 Tax=Conexibacter woesei (strain DSM 14684 / CCUG 47730 / CIP 108061 / JCM 11494 / NBRC 100937 / ID131577) TaxID=469383 RepID=D3F9C8_CONWI|nr:ABC transporter ATP-binding protein [Conexibacter woesei]ADB49095.1 ABC transporter related protein [Conexibacter woesei DSM 14684]